MNYCTEKGVFYDLHEYLVVVGKYCAIYWLLGNAIESDENISSECEIRCKLWHVSLEYTLKVDFCSSS